MPERPENHVGVGASFPGSRPDSDFVKAVKAEDAYKAKLRQKIAAFENQLRVAKDCNDDLQAALAAREEELRDRDEAIAQAQRDAETRAARLAALEAALRETREALETIASAESEYPAVRWLVGIAEAALSETK